MARDRVGLGPLAPLLEKIPFLGPGVRKILQPCGGRLLLIVPGRGTKHMRYFSILLAAALLPRVVPAQALKTDDYRKALWMATRFYGGQRSGEGPNWLTMDHGSGKDFVGDADGDYSLSGGWHDCGDHVKYGQTQFYSGYLLLKAYSEFPRGFDDFYGPDYSGYQKSGDFTWEGGKGGPNGIPDILDEVHYATDYFIKCARSESVFYHQVGDGNLDHKHWVTSVKMATLPKADGGQPRPVFKNPDDASMPSFCAAALAVMARVYRKFDAAYADLCLQHARYAFAKVHPGAIGTPDGGFYPANARWQDDYAAAAAELYRTTGESGFLDEAKAKAGNVADHNYTLCYNNNDDLAAYDLAQAGVSEKAALLQKLADRYKGSVNGAGVGTIGDSWGRLRFPMNQAFVTGLAGKLNGATTVDPFAWKNLDYVLGSNSAGLSFLVGFGAKSAQHPHHRNVYLSDDDKGPELAPPIPERNRQFGVLVGGTLDPSQFKDETGSYSFTEGCIDYNAGLVATLAYVLAMTAPVDTAKFSGHGSALAPRRGRIELRGAGEALINDALGRTQPVKAEGEGFGWFSPVLGSRP